VNAHEIIVHEVDRHHMRVVFGLFRKGIREPRHATVAHADIQILALYIACGDVLGVGIAFDAMLDCAGANGGAVAPLAFRSARRKSSRACA
jgi:hypothetical protein